MKIAAIFKFIGDMNILLESTPLTQIRKSIMGKGTPIKIAEDEEDWYSVNKDSLLNILNKIVGQNAEPDLRKLSNFDTDKYFTDEKPRKLKPKSLRNALSNHITAIQSRTEYSSKKSSMGYQNQYEKIDMKNGVEVYSVYTPNANIILSHSILNTPTCETPTWCIASPTGASNMWGHYHLYNAKHPCVFIVAQKLKNGSYNDMKYQIKANPEKTEDFIDGSISLSKFVDECRDPNQNEEKISRSSLFKNFDITPRELANALRKLMTSEKSEKFSENYGKEMRDSLYTNITRGTDDDLRIKYLIKACQNGFISDYVKYVKPEEKEFIIERLIEYGTLLPSDLRLLDANLTKDAINFFIKTKRCDYNLLNRLVLENWDKEIILKVFLAIDFSQLSFAVYERLGKVFGYDGCYKISFDYDRVTKGLLSYVLSFRKDLNQVDEIVDKLIENGRFEASIPTSLLQYDIPINRIEKSLNYAVENKIVDDTLLSNTLIFCKTKYSEEIIDILMEKNKFINEHKISSIIKHLDDVELALRVAKYIVKRGDISSKSIINLASALKYHPCVFKPIVDYVIGLGKVGDKTLSELMKHRYKNYYDDFIIAVLKKIDERGKFTDKTVDIVLKNPRHEDTGRVYDTLVKLMKDKKLINVYYGGCANYFRTISYYHSKKLFLDSLIKNKVASYDLLEYMDSAGYIDEFKDVYNILKKDHHDPSKMFYVLLSCDSVPGVVEMVKNTLKTMIKENLVTPMVLRKLLFLGTDEEKQLAKFIVRDLIEKDRIDNTVFEVLNTANMYDLMYEAALYSIEHGTFTGHPLRIVYSSKDAKLIKKVTKKLFDVGMITPQLLAYTSYENYNKLYKAVTEWLFKNKRMSVDCLSIFGERKDITNYRRLMQYLFDENEVSPMTLLYVLHYKTYDYLKKTLDELLRNGRFSTFLLEQIYHRTKYDFPDEVLDMLLDYFLAAKLPKDVIERYFTSEYHRKKIENVKY